MAHQRAVAAARLGERAHAAQIRNQRRHRRDGRRVEIALEPLEVGPLAHVSGPPRSMNRRLRNPANTPTLHFARHFECIGKSKCRGGVGRSVYECPERLFRPK